ncbi:STY4534 family ICE replication protein [Pantoea sp. RG18]|uniref:STY4534 family ICE replication protein n=1 Tax=Pantoea sp. RG18 TaxID=2981603 RepID=UPI00221F2CE7|nr:STY4534 family ICE replication protein [Pantoea sp. RG18]MCW0938437.1 STY4534 family ICE replication protein [Pantoea sp. RG18]
MTATTTNDAANNNTSTKAEYFNLNIKGQGYLSNIRRIETLNGGFLSVVINALGGPTYNPTYVRFDATVAGKEATDLISRCQKAVDEDQKVLLGFTLSNLTSDIFTLKKGNHAGEQRVSLKVWLIKVDWIKIGQAMGYKAENQIPPVKLN